MNTEDLISAKKEHDTLVLSHVYQTADIIDAADITGDSFFLSKKAQELNARRVIMCGVRFMAQTVKILLPDAEVILPVASATCPMAEQISPERVIEFRKTNPDAAVVCYINTTAELKAVCDVCVTSSSAVKIVSKLPQKDILFIPDKNLGAYVQKRLPEKNIILWDGFCPVHNAVTVDDVLEIKRSYPDAVFAVHPECPAPVAALADFVGATSEIIRYAKAQSSRVIIGTEESVADYLNLKENTDKYIQLRKGSFVCEDMKKITVSDVYKAISGTGGEIIKIDESTRLAAKNCLDKMLELGG